MPVKMEKYAAHDSFFLTLIAQKQIASISELHTPDADKSGVSQLKIASVNSDNFVVWFNNFQTKL